MSAESASISIRRVRRAAAEPPASRSTRDTREVRQHGRKVNGTARKAWSSRRNAPRLTPPRPAGARLAARKIAHGVAVVAERQESVGGGACTREDVAGTCACFPSELGALGARRSIRCATTAPRPRMNTLPAASAARRGARSRPTVGGRRRRGRGPRQKKGKKEGESRVHQPVRVRPAVRDAEMAECGARGGPAILCKGGTLWLVDGGGGSDGPSTPRGAPAARGRAAPEAAAAGRGSLSSTRACRRRQAARGVRGDVRRTERDQRRAGGRERLRDVLRPDGRGPDVHTGQRRRRERGDRTARSRRSWARRPSSGISCEVQLLLRPDLHGGRPRSATRDANVELREDPDEGFVLSGPRPSPSPRVEQALDLIASKRRPLPRRPPHLDERLVEPLALRADLDVRSRVGSRTARQAAPRRPGGVGAGEEVGGVGARVRRGVLHQQLAHVFGPLHRRLAAQGKGGVRPPFRETKLTRLLSSAFGGAPTPSSSSARRVALDAGRSKSCSLGSRR